MKKRPINIFYALYDDDDLLMEAIEHLKEKKKYIKEVYSPFPIHGLDKLLELKPTRLPKLAFLYGLFGIILASILTWYMMIKDWPQDIGGKPSFSWIENLPAFIPIIFELTIFCAAHFMALTYLFCCKLFPGAKAQNPDPRTTDDKFLMELHLEDDFKEEIINVLKKNHAIEIIQKQSVS